MCTDFISDFVGLETDREQKLIAVFKRLRSDSPESFNITVFERRQDSSIHVSIRCPRRAFLWSDWRMSLEVGGSICRYERGFAAADSIDYIAESVQKIIDTPVAEPEQGRRHNAG